MSRGMSEKCNLIGLPKSKSADSAQPRYRSIVTRPFSLLVRAGSGHETKEGEAGHVVEAAGHETTVHYY